MKHRTAKALKRGTTVKKQLPRRAKEPDEDHDAYNQAVPSGSDFVATTRKELGVTQEVFARLAGVSQRSVSAWESGGRINSGSRRRVVELSRLAVDLKKAMRANYISHWLVTPNNGLGGISPVEAIERGQNDRLWRIVFLLGSGIPT